MAQGWVEQGAPFGGRLCASLKPQSCRETKVCAGNHNPLYSLFLPSSSFVVASFGSSNWSLAIKTPFYAEQQRPLLLRGGLHFLLLFGNELRFL